MFFKSLHIKPKIEQHKTVKSRVCLFHEVTKEVLQELYKECDKCSRICLPFRSISVHPWFALLKILSLFVLCNIIFCPAIFGLFAPVWYLKTRLNNDSPNNSHIILTTYTFITWLNMRVSL